MVRTVKKPAKKPSKAPAKVAPAKAKTGKVARRKTTEAPAPPRAGRARSRHGVDGGIVSGPAASSDPELFAPLTAGEAVEAIRTLTEDRRLAGMAKVGRFRVIATEPLVVKPPHLMAGHRLARVVIYDYAADHCVDACVDLDAGIVSHLDINHAQPMLSREEEAVAISVAFADPRIRDKLSLGEEPLICTHYWGKDESDLAFARRSAAVVFGTQGGTPSVVAVVDLLDNIVSAVVPAPQW